ncbi:magnesium transporter CorA family protein [Aspergillus undulatus]|uniref:magnesium transporter CorA family protein n=1 Tax=Aspergillus undulatus TaxID=1810928 RepID=UPI003CCCA9D2
MTFEDSPHFSYFSCNSQQAHEASCWADLAPAVLDQEQNEKATDDTWWLDVCDATEEEVAAVARSLSIHPLTVEDIALQEPRQKIETFPGYYLISLRTLASSVDEEKAKSTDAAPFTPIISSPTMLFILVFSHGTVTFSRTGCGSVPRVRSRVCRVHDSSVLSSDWICYALLDEVIDSFQPHMEDLSRESEAIQDQIFIARDDDMTPLMMRIYNIRKRINHLAHSLSGKSDVMNGFVKRCQTKRWHPALPQGDLIVYLSDVQDHLVTILAELAHLDEITSRLQSNFLAQTSVNNMRLSTKLNSGLSKVTVLATIFVPLHMVTGLFGMNVTVPGQDIDSLAWFFGIVGVFVAVILVACFMAVRFKLL